MRLFLTLILGFMLMIFNQAYCCEHSTDSTSVVHIENIQKKHSPKHRTNMTVQHFAHMGNCCTGIGTVCCLTVSNSSIIHKAHHLVSEAIELHSELYQSYKSRTEPRPPCSPIV